MIHFTKGLNAPLSSYVRASLLAVFAFVICFTAVNSVSAATYTVTSTLDSGAGSLRQAVLDANGTAASDVINFNIPTSDAGCNATTGVCTITLTTGDITIVNNGSLTINGTGANRLTVNASGTSRIFYVNTATFTLSGITLTGGNGTGALTSGNGGAVFVVGGSTTINRVTISSNTASSRGAGIVYNGGTHTISGSTISGNINSTSDGGGIFVTGPGGATGNLTIINSTFSANSGFQGGALYSDNAATTLRNNTFVGNKSFGNTPGVTFAGIWVNPPNGGSLSVTNTIAADSIDANNASIADIGSENGSFTSLGYNLVRNRGSFSGNYIASDLPNGTNPLLGGLAFNGGTTLTYSLLSGSPAIDKGSAVAGVFSDGRGVIRPFDNPLIANAMSGNGADIGAFELVPTSQLGWGINNLGQVGDGTTTTRTLPTQIAGGFTDIVSVEGGSNHALGLFSNGTLMAWGSNSSGQLGDNTTTGSLSPVAVVGLTNVVAMVGGGNHSLALLADGTVWAWGSNINGQLGNQGTNNSLPAVVSGITNAVAVAAVANTSYALLADGSVVAWGRNSSGQLGDGTTTPRSTPGQVSGLTGGVISIEGGGNSCYAVLSDGSVVAWGNNSNGQLGDGTIINRLTPVPLLNLTSGVVQVAGGFFHAAALKSDGTLLTWGGNSEGQLGDGTTTNNSTPTAISLANVTQIKSSIGSVTYARLRDGSLFAWGANFNGAVGNGTTATAQTTPVRVSTDAGIGFFGAFGNGGYAGSPLAPVAAGANQFVRLGDATVNFLNVASAGTVQIRTFDPSTTGLTIPAGYTIEANSNGYDINSSAQFTGTATVCIKVPTVISQTAFNLLYIMHDDNGDGTLDPFLVSSRNYQKREICRTTTSFSPFVLASGPLAPTAANVSVSGRVLTASGYGLRNAIVQLTGMDGVTRRVNTSSFGYYRFDDVPAGETYIIGVASKRFTFAPRTITVADDLTDLDFAAQ